MILWVRANITQEKRENFLFFWEPRYRTYNSEVAVGSVGGFAWTRGSGGYGGCRIGNNPWVSREIQKPLGLFGCIGWG